MLDLLPLPSLLYALVSGIFEFSTGTLNVSALDIGIYEKLVLTSFIVGFSGLCVHILVMAATAGAGLDLKPYILGKLLHGGIAAVLTAAVIRLFPLTYGAFAGTGNVMYTAFAVIPLILAAAAVCVMLISALRFVRDR